MDERDVTCGELLLEENITTGKIDQNEVYLKRAQRKEGASPERSTYMPSRDDRIRELFASLNKEDQTEFLMVFEIALVEQSSPVSSPQMLEQEVH